MGRSGPSDQSDQLRPVSYGGRTDCRARRTITSPDFGHAWVGSGRIMPLTREIDVRFVLGVMGVMVFHVDVLHHRGSTERHGAERHDLLIGAPGGG